MAGLEFWIRQGGGHRATVPGEKLSDNCRNRPSGTSREATTVLLMWARDARSPPSLPPPPRRSWRSHSPARRRRRGSRGRAPPATRRARTAAATPPHAAATRPVGSSSGCRSATPAATSTRSWSSAGTRPPPSRPGVRHPRPPPLRPGRPPPQARQLAEAELVERVAELGGIAVDAVGAGLQQLVLAVAAGEDADPERSGATGGEQVPDRVADDERVLRVDAQPARALEEEV